MLHRNNGQNRCMQPELPQLMLVPDLVVQAVTLVKALLTQQKLEVWKKPLHPW